MKTPPPFLILSGLALAMLALFIPTASAAALTIANPSFEAPVLTDATFQQAPTVGSQGGYGWSFPVQPGSTGIYNPPANTYASAAGSGTPAGADGAQVAYIDRSTAANIFQTLAGPDGVLGNADDPLLSANTIYVLTLGVGQRLGGNQYGVNIFGGYDIRLLAGNTIIAEEKDVIIPATGQFVDRTIQVDSSTLNPGLYGSSLSIQLFSTQIYGAGVTDFDNARLTANVPEPSSTLLLCAGALCLSQRLFRKKRAAKSPGAAAA